MRVIALRQEVLIWISIFPIVATFMETCTKDCLKQAYAPCQILSSKTGCPSYTGTAESVPGPPTDLHISPVVFGSYLHLNVTWKPTSIGLENTRGFQIQYWDYTDQRDVNNGILSKCITYNITRNLAPPNDTTFYHDCVRASAHYIVLSSLPHNNERFNYLHRVTVAYEQNYGNYSAWWAPVLLVLHNDSCGSKVEVEFDVAPVRFKFRNYRVVIRDADIGKLGDIRLKDIKVDPEVQQYISTAFKDVPNGNFIVRIYPEHSDNGRLCKCPRCKEAGCHYISTSAFIISKNHSKCWKSLEASSEDESTIATFYLLPDHLYFWIVVFITIAVILCGLVFVVLVLKHRERPLYKKVNSSNNVITVTDSHDIPMTDLRSISEISEEISSQKNRHSEPSCYTVATEDLGGHHV